MCHPLCGAPGAFLIDAAVGRFGQIRGGTICSRRFRLGNIRARSVSQYPLHRKDSRRILRAFCISDSHKRIFVAPFCFPLSSALLPEKYIQGVPFSLRRHSFLSLCFREKKKMYVNELVEERRDKERETESERRGEREKGETNGLY